MTNDMRDIISPGVRGYLDGQAEAAERIADLERQLAQYEVARAVLTLLIERACIVNPGTGEVCYGEYDEHGRFIPPASLPNIPKLERQLAEAGQHERTRIIAVLRKIAEDLNFHPCSDNSTSRRAQTIYLADMLERGQT